MAEYIEREALLNEARKRAKAFSSVLIYEAIKEAPTADVVEVRHGEWFLLDECSNEGVYCSVCHKKVYKTNYANQKLKSKYCPNCGADMRGRTNGKK